MKISQYSNETPIRRITPGQVFIDHSDVYMIIEECMPVAYDDDTTKNAVRLADGKLFNFNLDYPVILDKDADLTVHTNFKT